MIASIGSRWSVPVGAGGNGSEGSHFTRVLAVPAPVRQQKENRPVEHPKFRRRNDQLALFHDEYDPSGAMEG